MSEELVDAIVEIREKDALRIAEDLLVSGSNPMEVLNRGREAMSIIGDRYSSGEYFVPELILGGKMMGQILDMAKPYIEEQEDDEESVTLGTVLIGTVKGDIHDIGKNLVTFFLDLGGFEVHDLGVDVAPERFIEAIKETGARVVGLSGFLTLSFDSMKETVEAIEKAGLRDRVKIMVGGGQIDEAISTYAGADAYGDNAQEAVRLAKQWMGG